MNPDDLARILDDLGRRLGPAGEHVFALAVRQQIIIGWLGLFMTIGAVVVLALWLTRTRIGDGFDRLVIGGVTLFALAASLFVFLPQVLNPEYAAVRDILAAIGGRR